MNDNVIDILLAQKFLPEHGGSIAWMHNVYRRWPNPVEVVTHDYYNVAPGTSSFPDKAIRPASGDHVASPNLIMDRRDIFIRDWGIESFARLRRYWRMNRAVKERLKRKTVNGMEDAKTRAAGKPTVRVHAIHAVPEVASLVPLKWRYGKRLKVICYAHGEEITACCSSRQLKFLMHRAHGIVDLMIANSQNTVRYLANHIDPKKVVVLHPGVELAAFEGFAAAGLRWRQQNGYEGRQIILTVGRMDPRKNHAAVIKAVAELAPKHPKLLYVAAGGGQLKDQLQRQAAELGVAERVLFPGEVDGPTKLALFGACDVFAMPAIQVGTDVEGFGMVFIEAGACGKPCVAGKTGGQPEAVIDGESGLVVDGMDGSSVAAALDRLLADPSLRQRMGEAGRRRAEELDWPRVVQRTVELVDKL